MVTGLRTKNNTVDDGLSRETREEIIDAIEQYLKTNNKEEPRW